jgi:adenosylcobinamide kinase/adenosylcobinamide-phosphate guanylyltransferase
MLAGRDIEAQISELKDVLSELGGPAALIANGVGAAVAPATPLGRAFRDWQGRLNLEVAAACGAVVAVFAGPPIRLKPDPQARHSVAPIRLKARKLWRLRASPG